MIGERQSETTDESGCEWMLVYEWYDGVHPLRWYQAGCQTSEVPMVIEDKLVTIAFEQMHERFADSQDYDDRETPIERVERLEISSR